MLKAIFRCTKSTIGFHFFDFSVIFVSLNEELGMPREEAATPFSMLGAVSNIFGKLSNL